MGIIRGVLVLFILLILGSAIYFCTRIETYATALLKESLPSYVIMKQGELTVNIFKGDISVKEIDLKLIDKGDTIQYAFIRIGQVNIDGFSYWEYFVNNRIDVNKIRIIDPYCTIYPSLKMSKSDTIEGAITKLNKLIVLDYFELKNGYFIIMQDNLDSMKLKISGLDIDVFDMKYDTTISGNKIPFTYDRINIGSSNVIVDLGPFEKLEMDRISGKDNCITVSNLSIRSKYSKSELLSHLAQEREHLSIEIPDIQLDSMRYGFIENKFYLIASTLKISDAKLIVHLDKRLKDRTKIKPMYSKVIRELPFDLKIDSTFLVNSIIAYEEKKDITVKEGVIYFDKLNAEIANISNVYPTGELTRIHANAQIMGESNVELDWSFDVNDEQDAFTIAGSASDFDASAVNQFLDANIKTTATGQVDQLYFTAFGNDKHAKGDMKIKYNNLKLEVQKNDRSGKHEIKSWVGNLLVNSGRSNDEEGYRHGKISVDRNRQKSFFNFLWLNVKDGLRNSVREKRRR